MADELDKFLDSVLGGSPKPQVRPQPSIDDKIDEYSKANGVDSKFVRAVMGQESAGNPNAKSWANAKGLLQILPETGKRYRKDFDPFNIDHNLDVGTRHLAYLEKKYKGDKKRVLAAYNAGEGNADQKDWWEQSQFWSNDRAVQKGLKPRGPQDKTNTRNYIEKIYGNYEKMSGGQSKDALDNFLDSVLGEPSAESALPTQAGEISETSTEYATPETLAKYGYQGDTWGQPSPSTQTPSPTVLGQQTIKIPEEPQLQGIVNPYSSNYRSTTAALPNAQNSDEISRLEQIVAQSQNPQRVANAKKRLEQLNTKSPNAQNPVENYSNDELEAGYKDYLDYTKEQDSPATKQKYLSLAGGTKSFGQPTEIKTQIPNEEVSRVGVPPTQTPQPDNYTRQVNTERYTKPEFYETAPQQTVAREVKTDEDYLETNASRIAVDITRKPSGMNLGEYILRTSLKANQPKYGYSDADIERVVADNKATYGNFTKQNYADWDDNQFGEIVNQFKRKYNGSTYINFDVSRNLINRALGGDNKRIADQLALEKPQVVREVSNPESLVNTVNRLTEGEAKAKTIEDLRNPSFSKIAEDTMTKALQRSTRAVISPFFFAFDAINDIKQTFSDLQGTVPFDQKRIEDEIKNIEKSYGSFADYQQIQATRRNMDWGEYGLRFGTNIVRSAVRTAVADSLKGIEVIGDLEEKVNRWSYLLPDRYAPSVRNLGNLIGFTYAKVKNPNITYDQMPGADSDIDKRLFYNIGKSIDESLGEDKYLRGTFGDALSQGLGSGVGFMLMGFLAPEASIAGRFSISSAILGTLTSAGSGYSEAKGENLTETQAKTYAYIQGLAGASEGFGVGATFAKSFKNANLKRMFLYDFASWLKSSGKSFLEGGAEEALQEFFQSTVGKSSMEAFKDKEPSVYQRALNIVNRLPGQMANTLVNEVPVAFLTGGLMDSSVQSIEAISSRNEGIRIDTKNNLIQMEGTRFSFDDKLKPTVEAWQQNELVLEKKYQEIQQVGKLLKTAKTPEQKGAAYERLLQLEKEVEGLANQSANLMQDISGNITPTDKQPNVDEFGEIAETPIAENLPSNEAQNQATAELQSNKQVEENQQVTPETKEKTGLQSNETLPTTKQESPSMESPEVVSSPMVESENEVNIQPKPAVADTSASKNNQSKIQSKPVESSTNISAEPVKQNRVLIEPKAKIEPVEETKTKHEFSSTQVNLPKKESAQIRSIGTKLVKDADLAKVDWNPRETEPHITVKYGLHTNNVDDVREIISAQRPFTVKLGKTSIFPAKEGSDYDVVKIDVDSPELHAINKAIAENTKVTDTHPTYQPHVTIAYVKKGEGQKYVGNTDFEGKTLTFNSIAFSDKDGKMVEIPLSKDTQVSTVENKDTLGEENAPYSENEHPLNWDVPSLYSNGRPIKQLKGLGDKVEIQYLDGKQETETVPVSDIRQPIGKTKFDGKMSPTAYEQQRQKEENLSPKQRLNRATKQLNQKIANYESMRSKTTTGNQRAELEGIAQFAKEENLRLPENLLNELDGLKSAELRANGEPDNKFADFVTKKLAEIRNTPQEIEELKPSEKVETEETEQGIALKSVSDLPTPTVEGFDSKAFEKELESIQLNKDSDGKILAPNGKISNIQNERLAKTIRTKAFKDWFGDSKVVDENGEPLVVYHGTGSDFDIFDKSGRGSGASAAGIGHWFSENSDLANAFAEFAVGDSHQVLPVLLKTQNPKIYEPLTETQLAEREKRQEEITKELAQNRQRQKEIDKEMGDIPIEEKYQNGFKGSERVQKLRAERESLAQQEQILYINRDEQKMTDPYEQLMADRDEFVERGQTPPRVRGSYRGHMMEKNTRQANEEFIAKLKADGYDGILIKNTEFDTSDTNEKTVNQYVVLDSNQIKSIFNQGSFDAENPSILKKVREEGDDDEQIRLAKSPTHELFDGGANFDKDGNLELSLKAAENIRRHLAELYYQKYGKETDEQIFGGLTMNRSMLRNLAKALKTTYDTALSPEMGYTAEELAGHKTVLDAIEKLAKETPVGVVYAFDEDLPEELFHKLDLMSGRTDGEAIRQIKGTKIWQYAMSRGSKFYSQYGSQSIQNQISEIVAKLATDQGERYGFTDLFDTSQEFEQAKEELLNMWADGVLRKNPKLSQDLANEIQKYATKEKATQNESADSGSDKSDKNESSASERSNEQSESATEGEESGRYAGGISEEQSGTRLRTPKYAEKSLQSDEVQYEQEKMSETERKGAELTRTVGIANILDQVRVATGNLPALMAAVYQEQKRLNALADKFKEEGKEAEYNATLESLNALSTDIITAQIQSGRAVNIAKTLEPLSAENAINVLTRLKRQFTGNENESLTTAETKLVKEIQAKLDKASRNLRNKTSMVDRLRKKIKDITDGKYILRPRKNKDGKTERPQTFIQKAVAQKLNSDFDELLAELQSDVGLLKSVWRFDTARPQVSKTDKSIFWHGSDNGDLRGGTTGLHIGTFQAAKEALEARIGVPAEGEWDGTREYGKTKLAGRKTLDRIEKETGKYIKTGHNVGSDLPENDYFPQERSYRATYSNGELVPLNAMPVIEPVKITGKMTNSTWSPHDDYKANGYMKAALKKGNAKNGYYYKNEAEDYGSISAVVPNEQHLERLWKDVGTSIDDFVALKSVADKRLPAQFKDAVSKVGAKILNDGLTSGREFNDKEFAREISQTLGKEFSPYSDEIIKLSWEKLADLKLEAKRQKLIDEGMTAEQADAELETKKNLARARAQAIASIRAIAKREARHQLTRANYEAHLADNDKLSAEEKANIIHAGMILSETKGLDTNSLIKKIREELGVSIDKALQIAKQAKQAKDEINARLREEKLLAKGKLPEEIEAERESRKEQMQATNEMNQLLKTVSDDTGLIKRFNNDFRAKLVLNHATQLFNMIQSATPVIGTMSQEIYTDVWDTALRAIRRKMGKENELDKIAPNVGFDALLPYAYLFSSNRQVAEGILAEFPEEYFRLELGILPDVNLDLNQVKGKNALSKLAHKWFDKNQVVNEKLATITGAKWQEAHFRSLTFLATLDQIARDKGDKLKDVLEQNRAGEYFTEAQIKNAVDKALRVTFAEQMDDRVGKSLKRLYDKTDHYLPVLLNPAVYARFTYTVSRAVINAHTFGMLDAESLGGNGYNTRSAAKGIYGLTAIGIGLALLSNFGGGDDDDKWYHLYFDGKDNPPIDVRRFFPVSAYVYTAYLIRRSIEGRDILKGRNLGEKFAELFENYASLDFDQYGRSPGMEFVRNIFDSDKTNYDLFKSGAKLTGNFFAGFLRFFKPIRQLVAQIDADESAYRNYDKSAQDAFVGELAKSVPFVGKAYGAEKKMNPITKEPVQEIAPLAKMVGLNFTNPMFISPNPTPATEKAEKLFPYDGPANDMNADQLEAYRIRKEIKEQVRAGKMSAKEVEPLIDSYEKEGKLTERSADYLKKSLTLSDLQETLRSRFSFADEKDVKNLKQVWETANPIEQNQIADVLERKLKTAVDKKEQKAVAVGNRLFSELGLTFDYKKVKNEIKQDKKEQSNKPNPWKIPPLK